MPFDKPLLLVAVDPIGSYDRPDEDRVLLGEHVASLWSDAGLIAALLATQLVVTLYGAGVRRPFGSLPRIPDVPYSLWYAQRLVTLADVIFATFVLVMVVTLFLRMNAFVFIVLSLLFFAFGERLSYRIRLVPSFFVSLGLAALAVTLICGHAYFFE